MKVFFVFCVLVSSVYASAIPVEYAQAVGHELKVTTGVSSSSRTQDAQGNYAFAFEEQHATGGSSRKEAGSPGVATGSYTLNVADGRQRVVNYVADAAGFRAAIATNEPGTAAQPAANTAISSPYAPPQAPPVPVVHAPLIEPVVHAAPALAVAAPVVQHAHLAVHHVPAISSYSTSVNHAFAAPVVHAAPALAVAPVHHAHLAAPLLHHYRK